jgi:hypothetical protein
MEALRKKTYLEQYGFQLVGEHKTDLDSIKLHIENWKKMVSSIRRHMKKFNKILDAL